ncbi:MAG: peptidoglycan DD-metalloendopeptidase family protein [Patescibacteria group bacterium]
MRAKQFFVALGFVVAVLLMLLIGSSWALDKTSTGFYYPTGTSTLGKYAGWLASGCDGNTDYFTDPPRYHLGWDIESNEGDSVYPISYGEVVYKSSSDWGSGNIALAVKHVLSNGDEFLALYGHIISSLDIGDYVLPGKSFATVGSWPYGAHLHFGIQPRSSMPATNWGKMPCSNWPDTNGFVNPIEWIENQKPIAGILAQIEGQDPIYWLQNGKAYHVLSFDTINAMNTLPGWGRDKIYIYPPDVLKILPPGSTSSEGSFVQGPDFITTESGSNGLLVKLQNDPKVYLIENGERRHITSPEVFTQRGYDWNDVIDVSQNILNLFKEGIPISPNIAHGGIIDFEEFRANTLGGLGGWQEIKDFYSGVGVFFAGATSLSKADSSLNWPEFPPHSGDALIYDNIGGTGEISITFTVPATIVSGYYTYNRQLTLEALDVNGNIVKTKKSSFYANYVSTGNPPNEYIELSYSGGIKSLRVRDSGNTYTIDDLGIKNVLTESVSLLPEIFVLSYQDLDTINQGQSKWKQFLNDIFHTLKIILGWEGSEFSIRIYRPDGSLFNEYQSNTPPIEIDIPNAEPGEWQFEITAIDVPYDNYPFALVVGVQSNLPPVNQPPVAICKDITVSADSGCIGTASIDNGSYDPDGDPITITQNPPGPYSLGLTVVTLTVTDSLRASSSCTGTVTVIDNTPPTATIKNPLNNVALQDGVTLTAEAGDSCGVDGVYFYVREPGGSAGIPIGYENLLASLNSISGFWEYNFNTTLLPDGYYVILAKAIDTYGNEGWSTLVPFSIRNWAVIKLLPASESNKAGRTMPVKFSLRIASSVDPAQPFVYNEDLEIRIYDKSNPGVILQNSLYGDSAKDYRIDSIGEKYITNFKTGKQPAEYVVEIWRINKNWLVGSFTFETMK